MTSESILRGEQSFLPARRHDFICLSTVRDCVICCTQDDRDLYIYPLSDPTGVRVLSDVVRFTDVLYRFLQSNFIHLTADESMVLYPDNFAHKIRTIDIGSGITGEILLPSSMRFPIQAMDCNAEIVLAYVSVHDRIMAMRLSDTSVALDLDIGPILGTAPRSVHLSPSGREFVTVSSRLMRPSTAPTINIFSIHGAHLHGFSLDDIPSLVNPIFIDVIYGHTGSEVIAFRHVEGGVIQITTDGSGIVAISDTMASPIAMSKMSRGKFAVLDVSGEVTVIRNCALRMEFITACVSLAKQVHKTQQ